MTMLERALALALQGFYVFPIREGRKEPAITGWPHRATTDPDQIAKWWGPSHSSRNIGIATEPSQLIVVDLDDKSGKKGSEEFAKLCETNGHVDTLMVQTPTGGAHLYYRVPDGKTLKSSANLLAPGIDTRATGGFVVAPGSTTSVGHYTTIIEADIPNCPEWIVERMLRPKTAKTSDIMNLELDAPIDVKAAIEYLTMVEPAIEGDAGDEHTYKVCCHLHNLGISIQVGVELLQQYWNPQCAPPWSTIDLVEKMDRAYKYAKDEPGCKSLNLPSVKPKIIHCVSGIPEAIPPRDWIIDGRLISGYVTLTVAPGGVGKSMYTMLEALAVATGRNLTGVAPVKTGPVLIYNTEDPQDEIERRLLALCRYYNIDSKTVDNVYYASGVESPLRLVISQNGRPIITKDRQTLEEIIRDHHIVLVVVDPFVRAHSVNENSNNEIDLVVQQLSALAISTQCAVSVVHHTRKLSGSSQDDSMDISRGASALVSAARVVSTLTPPSEQDMEALGLDDTMVWQYVKHIRVKGNMSKGDTKPTWFLKEEVELANGDIVGVLHLRDGTVQTINGLMSPDTPIGQAIADQVCPGLGTGPLPLSVLVAQIASDLPFVLHGMPMTERSIYVYGLLPMEGLNYVVRMDGNEVIIGERNVS